MRFQLSQVMDAIEQRLTTDITGAQAVVDLGQVVQHVPFDQGRSVNLVRIGMVVDALGRYLVDGGAMLYGVVERSLLSEGALTSKERMVLSRWADDGLIEVVAAIEDRPVEVADLTGLPLITLEPMPDLTAQYRWLSEDPGRVLLLRYRDGVVILQPIGEPAAPPVDSPVVGRAAVSVASSTEGEAPAEPAGEVAAEPAGEAPAEPAGEAPAAVSPPTALTVFASRGTAEPTRTRVSWRRFALADPAPTHAALLAREWRCDAFECPVFGELRRIGQSVPRLRDGRPVCPRHGEPVVDIGPRRPAYPVSVVVEDLPRRRVVVRQGQPVRVGRADGGDDPAVVSVAHWLHASASAWISPLHVELTAEEDGLTITDRSGNGSVVWQRKSPDDPGVTRTLHGEAYLLGEWDSVELYTGIELMRGDRRLAAVLSRFELGSVLLDAPTAAYQQVQGGATG